MHRHGECVCVYNILLYDYCYYVPVSGRSTSVQLEVGRGGCMLGDFAFSSVCQQRNLYAPRGVQTSGLPLLHERSVCVYRVQLVCVRVLACIQRTRLNRYTMYIRILYIIIT